MIQTWPLDCKTHIPSLFIISAVNYLYHRTLHPFYQVKSDAFFRAIDFLELDRTSGDGGVLIGKSQKRTILHCDSKRQKTHSSFYATQILLYPWRICEHQSTPGAKTGYRGKLLQRKGNNQKSFRTDVLWSTECDETHHQPILVNCPSFPSAPYVISNVPYIPSLVTY